MDYMLNPMICIIWCGQQAHVFVPQVPYVAWAVFFAVVFTGLNIQGIKTSARVNTLLAAGMGAVVVVFFLAALRYILGLHHEPGFFTRPFYDPQLWSVKAVLGATSVAVLSYIGFDGISTLSEEAENPRRNILLATVLTCFVIGILSALEVYGAQLIWPASSQPFPNSDTAFTYVAGRAWGPLFGVVGFTLVVANFGSGMGAQIGAARLLYGMGRGKALPQSFFGAVDTKRHVPRNNVVFVGGVALVGAFIISYGLGAEMLNFGALIAFMGVNLAAFYRYHVREGGKKPFLPLLITCGVIALGLWPSQNFWMLGIAGLGLIILAVHTPPLAGLVICFFLWKNLSWKAWIVGGIWMIVGIVFGAIKTRGFRGNLIDFEVPPE